MKRRRRQIQRNRRVAIFFTLVLTVLTGSVLSNRSQAQAQRQPLYKYYTDVRVHRGDTLWSIAREYMTDGYASTAEYIKEIKEINQLGAELQYGQLLLIPYYSDERK